jgi:hypothetical protein
MLHASQANVARKMGCYLWPELYPPVDIQIDTLHTSIEYIGTFLIIGFTVVAKITNVLIQGVQNTVTPASSHIASSLKCVVLYQMIDMNVVFI